MWLDLALTSLSIALFATPLVLSVWALLDAARRPGWVWAFAERNRAGWMAAILFGLLSVLFGLVIATAYLLRVRPHLAAVEDGDLGG